jgi:hypothetical protein
MACCARRSPHFAPCKRRSDKRLQANRSTGRASLVAPRGERSHTQGTLVRAALLQFLAIIVPKDLVDSTNRTKKAPPRGGANRPAETCVTPLPQADRARG